MSKKQDGDGWERDETENMGERGTRQGTWGKKREKKENMVERETRSMG